MGCDVHAEISFRDNRAARCSPTGVDGAPIFSKLVEDKFLGLCRRSSSLINPFYVQTDTDNNQTSMRTDRWTEGIMGPLLMSSWRCRRVYGKPE